VLKSPAEGQQSEQGPIRSVVIVGGGTAGWMTASLLSRLYGAKLDITLVESDEISTIGVGEATIPAIKNFNRLLGIDENDFLRSTQGSFKMGIEFRNWGQLGDQYMHGFGKIGQDLGWLRMHQYWLKARQLGKASHFDNYAINVVAARRNRFMPARPDMPESPLGEIAHAYHFDAGLYVQYLRRFAEGWGVKRIEGRIVSTRLKPENGFVEAVVMQSGAEVTGELFIDCSGIRALLIEGALRTGYEEWGHWLPCDRALAVPCRSVSPLTPYTRSTAHKAGWQWRIPLQHRIGNGHVFSSGFMGEDEASSILMSNLDGEALADPRLIRFTTGKRKKIWNRNVVAIGLSSGFLEPLESTSIHLIQTNILRLVALFPDRSFRKADQDEFNRQAEFEYTRIRDFIIAHYKQTERTDSEMWRYCRHMDIPDTLQQKLDNFSSAGRVIKVADELFAEESWIQVLIGQGLVPDSYDPAVDIRSEADILAYLGNIEGVISKCADLVPDHAAYIAQNCKAPEVAL
jgi:tryptophan halogenase